MIIFLFGENTFSSWEKVDEIRKKFLVNNPAKSGLFVFDFQEEKNKLSFFKIEKVLGAPGLFSQKQLVIVKNFFKVSNKEEIKKAVKFFTDREDIFKDQDIVIIFWEAELGKGKNELKDIFLKKAKKQECRAFFGIKLSAWISERIKKSGLAVDISRKAMEKLATHSSSDLWFLSQEIEKLLNFKSNGIIEEDDIDKIVFAKTTADIFETIEAVSSGDKKRALEKLYGQIKKSDDTHYVFSMYVYHFRNLLKVSEFVNSGIRNNYEIAKLTGLHPFVVQKAIISADRFGCDKLKNIYQELAQLDLEIKTGKTDILIALDKLIIEL